MQKSKLVIVGGGSSGWMAACYLNKVLAANNSNVASVVLIESPTVPTIGVGESTFDSFRKFLKFIDISESEFVQQSDATLKHGILFRNWYSENHEYFHPFEFINANDQHSLIEHWLNSQRESGPTSNIADRIGVQYQLAKQRKSPKTLDDADFVGRLPYSYHIDAIRMAQFLKDTAVRRGVDHIKGHVSKVVIGKQGEIVALEVEGIGQVSGDIFVDCTGFAGVLMKALGGDDDFEDYSPLLLCDKAVAARVPVDRSSNEDPRPYTSSTAQESGWIWDIDLHRRRGVGYVYSSEFSDAERAETILREYIGGRDSDYDVRFLNMRVGRRREFWRKNCIAIGLSGGFIEPLESTGLVFVHSGLSFLREYSLLDWRNNSIVNQYNQSMTSLYDETRDFILLHYILNKREGPFWDFYSRGISLPESLQQKLSVWRSKPPSSTDFSGVISPFQTASYAFILYGMEWKHGSVPNSVRGINGARSREIISRIDQYRGEFLSASCSHSESLINFWKQT